MTEPTAKLSLRGVAKRFGAKIVLSGVDLDVAKGESTVIVGGSGTGKSVLLKSILGLIRPDSGTIYVDGRDATRLRGPDLDRMREKFGMLFQGGALFDSLRVWQNVAFGLTQGKGMSAKQAKPIALEKLASVGLSSDVAELFPAELSGGMQKRVALARAIATTPQILFFDEPTTGLDPIMSDAIDQLIRKCVKELGATALTITHDMASVRKIADYVAMLHDGKIIWYGPVDRIERSGNELVDQFIHGRAQGPIQMQIRHS